MSAEEAKSKAEQLQLGKAVLERAVLGDRCEQLLRQLVRAEAHMRDAWEQKAMYKERCHRLELQFAEVRQPEDKRMRT